MEKFSSIDRVVGKIPEAEKEQLHQEAIEIFNDQEFEHLKGKEREKTREELEIIGIANDISDKIRKKYGLKAFRVPPENIHVIREDQWERRGQGVYKWNLQGVAVREEISRFSSLKTNLHEMLHLKMYNALQVTHDEEQKLTQYRSGINIQSRDGKREYLNNLNEAVVEEMTKRYTEEYKNHPLFHQEIKETERLIQAYPSARAISGGPLFDEDTIYAAVNKKNIVRNWVGRIFGSQENSPELLTANHVYKKERRMLLLLIEKLYQRNQEQFMSQEEVFEIFERAVVTGDMLPLGRLVDGTFGAKTLRKIGELDDNIEAQRDFVKSL